MANSIDNNFSNELFQLHKENLKNLRKVQFTTNDSSILHSQIIPFASYSPWLNDQQFMVVYNQIKENTLVDIYRCFELWNLVSNLKNVDGNILEVGVWKGGTGALIASALRNISTNSKVFLVDTFEGVVKAGEYDTTYKGGEHADTSVSIVGRLIEKLDLNNTKIVKGIFPDEVNLNAELSKIRLCHIDVDTYQSAKDVFEAIWPQIEIGGFVVFDDYGFWGCEGVTVLCNELQQQITNGSFIHNLNGHGIFIKHE